MPFFYVTLLGTFLLPTNLTADDDEIIKATAIAEFGEPLYDGNINHLPYANPDAKKGGRVVLGAFGTFDTLNFYVQKGEWPSSIGAIYDQLMTESADEIGVHYGLIAENVEYPADISWAIFNLRADAMYHDGVPVTAGDFVLSFNTIKNHGRAFIQSFYSDVLTAEALSPRRLKFTFATRDSIKPLTVAAGMYPLPVHFWADKEITEPTLDAPLTSGPYRVKQVDPGRAITYERVKNYWAADLPIKRGLHNFDEVRYEYYRDLTVEFEAFKAGEIDFRSESSAKRWVTEYDFDAVKSGEVIIDEVPSKKPRGMGGYFFNMNRERFSDVRVREALMTLYDFEAIQRTLLYGKYKRINSYFPNSDYGARGAPSDAEKKLLASLNMDLTDGITTRAFAPPTTDGSGRNRNGKRRALKLFAQAGWHLKNGKLVSKNTGKQFQVELMTSYPESRRLALPFVEALKKTGIDASIRMVDTSQWRVRIQESDFDLWIGGLNFFPPPGTELHNYFGSESTGGNHGGIKNPAVDALIDIIVEAKTLETLQTATRALDRVMLWNHYVIPAYYNDVAWVAYWNRFEYPAQRPIYKLGFPATWWSNEK